MADPVTTAREVAPGGLRELREVFERQRLSPAQRRIARYLLEHPGECVFLTAMDLATHVGVSQPSVTRFAVALGFSGYPELLRELRRMLLARGDAVAPAQGNAFQAAIAQEIGNLQRLAANLYDPSGVTELGRHLAGSTPLVVAGLRISAPYAELFSYLARKAHRDVRLVRQADSAAVDALAQARADGASWLLVFGLPRYPRELADLLSEARQLGYRTALITDDVMSPLSSHVEMILAAPVGSGLVFDSAAAPLLLSTAVLQAMYDALPPEQQQRLEDFETSAAARRLFLS